MTKIHPIESLPHPYKNLKILEVEKINLRTVNIFVDDSSDADPGQFGMVWLPGIGEKPYSLAGVKPLRFVVVDAGPFSHRVQGLKRGDRIWFRGPLGHGFRLMGRKGLMVAGGYGAAPLLFLAKRAVEKKMEIQVCLGGKTQSDLILQKEFLKTDAKLQLATEDGSAGFHGLVTKLTEKLLVGYKPDYLYACGPNPMLEKIEEITEKLSVPCQLSWEAHMRCGIGVCGSCELNRDAKGNGWLVCQDGPVQIIGK